MYLILTLSALAGANPIASASNVLAVILVIAHLLSEPPPHWHHGRGVFGQLVAPQTNGTTSPSAIRIEPTSRPLDFNVPQSRPQLQNCVPCLLAGQEHSTYTKSR